MAATVAQEETAEPERAQCCGLYHRAVELIGKRWTGAIVLVLLDNGRLHFSSIRQLVPELSDRLLSERLKELEAEGVVERRVIDGAPVRVEYSLTEKGRALEPAVRALKRWGREWLADPKA
jgi:DNA-binding HxlR family transcriptional regulator